MALGPIYLASLLGLPIVPVGCAIDNPYRLGTWDRFAIPKPFSRVRMIFGPKIRIPRKLKRKQLEASRVSVQGFMNDLCDHAESWACSGQKMVGEQPFVRARRCNEIDFSKVNAPPVVEQECETLPSGLKIVRKSKVA